MLSKGAQYSMIRKELIPRFELVECLQGQNTERCKNELDHNMHELMPPRIKIVPQGDTNQVYKYTSPIRAEFVIRKLLKFTVPVAVIPSQAKTQEEMVEEVAKFDEVRIHENVIYALVSNEQKVIENFYPVAEALRERFYFFHMKPEGEEVAGSFIYAIGNNNKFTKYNISPKDTK